MPRPPERPGRYPGRFRPAGSSSAAGLRVAAAALFLVGCGGGGPIVHPPPEELLANRAFEWVTVSTVRSVIHVPEGSLSAERTAELTDRIERSISRAQSLARGTTGSAVDSLRPETPPADWDPVHVFAVGDRRSVKRLTGFDTDAIAFYRTSVVVVIVTPDRWNAGPHEFTHLAMVREHGPATEWWMGEGLAVFAEDSYGGHDLHAIVKSLLRRGDLPPLERIVPRLEGREWRVFYPMAGSFVKFLYKTYGADALFELYRDGAAAVPRVLGKSLRDVEWEWHAAVSDAADIEYDF